MLSRKHINAGKINVKIVVFTKNELRTTLNGKEIVRLLSYSLTEHLTDLNSDDIYFLVPCLKALNVPTGENGVFSKRYLLLYSAFQTLSLYCLALQNMNSVRQRLASNEKKVFQSKYGSNTDPFTKQLRFRIEVNLFPAGIYLLKVYVYVYVCFI